MSGHPSLRLADRRCQRGRSQWRCASGHRRHAIPQRTLVLRNLRTPDQRHPEDRRAAANGMVPGRIAAALQRARACDFRCERGRHRGSRS